MKKFLAIALASAMVLSLAACGGAATTTTNAETQAAAATVAPTTQVTNEVVTKEAATAAEGETLTYKKRITIAHHQANVSRGPQDNYSGMQKIIEFMTFNQLTAFNPDTKKMEGELAESWTTEEGGKVWTFKLKKGVKFQNGEELKADDVVYTMERAKELGKCTGAMTGAIEKVEAVDDYTVKFTLTGPNMDYDFTLTNAYASILNRKACEEDPEIGYGIGTGGWKIKEFAANDYTLWERFDDSFVWWDTGVSPTEEIKVVYMADQNARMLGVQAGDLDIGCIANNTEYDNYKADPSLNPVICASYSNDYVGMNALCEYFQDENVRKAVAYALNREEALEIVNNGFGIPLYNMWCIDTIGYKDNFDEKWEYNLEKAKEYLAKSKYPNGFSCRLTTISSYSLYAETVQAQLAAIGINCEVDLTDSPGMGEGGTNGTFEMYVWNTTQSPYGDNMRNLITTDGAANYAHFSNARIDELMDAGVAETDEAKRAEIYGQVQDELHNDAYIVPLFYGYLSNLTRANVEGYIFSSQGYDFTYVKAVED